MNAVEILEKARARGNESAFPGSVSNYYQPGGMTIREYFIANALSGLRGSSPASAGEGAMRAADAALIASVNGGAIDDLLNECDRMMKVAGLVSESFMTCVSNLDASKTGEIGTHGLVIKFKDLEKAQKLYSLLLGQ